MFKKLYKMAIGLSIINKKNIITQWTHSLKVKQKIYINKLSGWLFIVNKVIHRKHSYLLENRIYKCTLLANIFDLYIYYILTDVTEIILYKHEKKMIKKKKLNTKKIKLHT